MRMLLGIAVNRDGNGGARVKTALTSRFSKKQQDPGPAKAAIRDTLRFVRVTAQLPVACQSCLLAWPDDICTAAFFIDQADRPNFTFQPRGWV